MIKLDFAKFGNMKIVNSHVHFESISLIKETFDFFQTLNVEKLGIVSYADPGRANSNPQAICFKAAYPEDVYIMGGLDYTGLKSHSKGKIEKELADQLQRMMEIGFDGVKLLETKPTMYTKMPFDIDSSVYNSFFALLEKDQIPICWHVADPEEFWDKEKIPAGARKMGWDYTDGTYPPKEKFYSRVENILHKFPRLKVVFAHFYFLSADLSRAETIMERYPGVNFDITPGTEMYHNFSQNQQRSREFFAEYQDRILFGDDTLVREEEIRRREISDKIFFIRDFLETGEELPMVKGDETFLETKGQIRGIELSKQILEKIYSKNFFSVVGEKPSPLDIPLGQKECQRIGNELKRIYGFRTEENFAYEAEKFLSSSGKP